jgi:hypothetical protein
MFTLYYRHLLFLDLFCFMLTFPSFISFCAAVSLISFWWESGGEIQWNDAANFALDEGARKVAMSGSTYAMVASGIIFVLSFVAKDAINSAVETMVTSSRMALEIGMQKSFACCTSTVP